MADIRPEHGELRTLFLRRQKVFYGLLIKTSAECMRDLADESKYVGTEVGIFAVLHMWTGQLYHHLHGDMLVNDRVVSVDGSAWYDASPGFLVPIKKLSLMIGRRFAEVLHKRHLDLIQKIPTRHSRRKSYFPGRMTI